MSKELDKEKVIQNKKRAIRKLNSLLESFIAKDNEEMLKKANLLSYWITSYSKYIKEEKDFRPTDLIAYHRGDIIKVNFGFNVGSEYGGLHYAVVLDKKNDHNSSLVTVIPLTSGAEEDTYRTDVYLGNELVSKMKARYSSLLLTTSKEMDDCINMSNAFDSSRATIQKAIESCDKDDTKTLNELTNAMQLLEVQALKLQQQIAKCEAENAKLQKIRSELERMKSGSIALMKQVTTVNKMRIFVPKNSSDPLYKISLSETNMDKINDRLKELYIF